MLELCSTRGCVFFLLRSACLHLGVRQSLVLSFLLLASLPREGGWAKTTLHLSESGDQNGNGTWIRLPTDL